MYTVVHMLWLLCFPSITNSECAVRAPVPTVVPFAHDTFFRAVIPPFVFVPHLQSVQTSQRLQQLLASLAGGAPPVVRQMLDPVSLPMLTLPYLLEIISPSLRPVRMDGCLLE